MAHSRYGRTTIYFLISAVLYSVVAYGISRSDFLIFISLMGALFGIYFFTIKEFLQTKTDIKWGVAAAVIFRLILLISIPNLSDDFYRFIWDGTLFASGLNPFLETPEFYKESGKMVSLGISPVVFEGLNSAGYYTVYPPVSQYIFGLGAQLFEDQILANVVFIRSFILAAEIGTILIIKKLLKRFKLNPAYVLIYALNPFIIIELTGNLHFEGVMIFFLVAAYFLFLEKKYWMAAVLFLLSVNTKLIPLVLIPYLVFSLDWRKWAALIFVTGAGTMLLFSPFLEPAFITNFSDSLGLYFQTFEFNASIYYLVRWVGFQIKGYNIIQQAGPYLAVISTCLIFLISWIYRNKKLKNLPFIYIIILTTYYLFTTTVHPWYISSLVAFVPLTGLLYPLAWSALVPLTYATYVTAEYNENLWLVGIEYLIVFFVVIYELRRMRHRPFKKLNDFFLNKRRV